MRAGTRSILFGPKHFILRPILSLIAWRKLYGKIDSIETLITIFIQFLGFWGKSINSDTEIERIQYAERITNRFRKHRIVKFSFGVGLEEALRMIRKTTESGKWTILEVSEEFNDNPEQYITTTITLLNIGKDSQWTKMLSGSNKRRAEQKMVAISNLFYVNELSLQLVPKWLIKLLTYLSEDPEGKKELWRRENATNNKIKTKGKPGP